MKKQIKMKYQLLVLVIVVLFMITITSAIVSAQITCLVGGTSSADDNAGWFVNTSRIPSQAHAGSGDALHGQVNATYGNDGSGDVQINIDGEALSTWVDLYANCFNFGGSETDGRYLITSVDTGADTFVINLSYVGGGDGTVDINVGGAVPNTYNVVAYDLEDVLDDSLGSAASQNVQILIHTQADVDPAESQMIDSNGGAGAYWKRIIGVDSDYAALPVGSYAVFDCGAVGLGDGLPIFNCDQDNIRFENIAALNPDGSGGTPASGENGFTNTGDNVQFINCYVERAYQGVSLATGGDRCSVINCVVSEVVHRTLLISSIGAVIKGGLFDKGTIFAAEKNMTVTAPTSMTDTVIVGGTVGIIHVGAGYAAYISDCAFIGQSEAAYRNSNATATAILSNCIFDVIDTAVDYAILRSSGSIFEFNNITDADTQVLSGFQDDSGSIYNLTFSNTDPWVSISGGDYRINWGQSIANTYVIDQGFVPYFGVSTGTYNKSNLGVWNYQQARPKAVRR